MIILQHITFIISSVPFEILMGVHPFCVMPFAWTCSEELYENNHHSFI